MQTVCLQNTPRRGFGLTASLIGSRLSALIFGVFCLGLFSLGSEMLQAASGVRDEAGFFSEPARREAAQRIGRILKEARQEVLIETLKGLPEAERAGVDPKDRAALNQRMEGFAKAQRDRHRVSGIYVLVIREPGRLEVVSGNEARRRGFAAAERSELIKVMTGELQARRFDQALLSALGSVEKSLGVAGKPAVSAADATGSKESDSMMTLLKWGAIFLGIVVLIRLLKAMFSPGGSPYGPGSGLGAGGGAGLGGPGGGGGFFRSLMGGLFGAAAGMWIYDQFFGHRSEGSFFDSHDSGFSGTSPMDSSDSEASGSDIDFGSESGSGSFGDDSAGSGFGSGDSGGSDWGGGGGDWGGGDA
jgi:hypothetical protein